MTESNRIIAGIVIAGVGYIDMAKIESKNLEEASSLYVEMLEDEVLKKPALRDECNQKISKSDKERDDYDQRVLDIMFKTASRFESTPGTGSVAGSREASTHRVQRRYVNVKHLLHNTLVQECTTSEFNIWVNTAYPDFISNTRKKNEVSCNEACEGPAAFQL